MTKTSKAAEYLDPTDLKPWDRNPRNNEHVVAGVAASIKRFGFAAPIVARLENKRVIAGHTRLLAALSLGLDQVPVRLLDVTEEQATALALADNKLGELSYWNTPDLAAVIDDLGTEAAGLGWTQTEIDALLKELSPTPPEFPEFGADIEVSWKCPKCSYTWSGAKE